MKKGKWSRWSLQLFVREKFHTHFESFVWGHHVGFLLRDTNMVTEKIKEPCYRGLQDDTWKYCYSNFNRRTVQINKHPKAWPLFSTHVRQLSLSRPRDDTATTSESSKLQFSEVSWLCLRSHCLQRSLFGGEGRCVTRQKRLY